MVHLTLANTAPVVVDVSSVVLRVDEDVSPTGTPLFPLVRLVGFGVWTLGWGCERGSCVCVGIWSRTIRLTCRLCGRCLCLSIDAASG